MFAHEFVRNAYLAGTAIALACGLTGYFLVLRSQVFAGDALSHVTFTGAVAAAAAGIDERVGLLAATMLVAVGLGCLGRGARGDDVVIGSGFAWVLGLGALALGLVDSAGHGGNGLIAANALFGSIFGLSAGAAQLTAVVGAAACVVLIGIARPLFFASIDPSVALARGVPARGLGVLFLGLLAVVTAQASPAIGALLVLGLLSAPAGAAQRLTGRPFAGLALAGAIAVVAMWGGLALSFSVPSLPPSSAVVAIAVMCFATAGVAQRHRDRAAA